MFYLDANASEPLRPEAKAAMQEAFEVTGNPNPQVHRRRPRSRAHSGGRARERIAGSVSVRATRMSSSHRVAPRLTRWQCMH